MREYRVSHRGTRLITRDNIIQVLEELGYNPGEGGGGFELDGVFNWYLRTGQGVGVQAPDLDLVGTEGYPWTANYQPPTANPDEKYVWKFTDFRYKDGSTPENPVLHITVGPELITTFTSGGGMGVEFAYALFDQDITEVILSENDGDLPVSEAPNAIPQEGGEWTKSLDSLSYDADSYLWMSQRKISADGIPALWEKPIRLSGADGDPGADAFDTEFIYHRSGRKPTTEDDNLLHVDNIRSQDDYIPNNSNWTWTDNPQGVDNDIPEHKYEWMAFRIKMDPTHPDYDSSHPEWKWSHWSTIRIWSAYGDKGMDGDGIQYIYNNKFVPTESVPNLAAPQGPIFIDRSGTSHTWNGDVYYSTGSWYPKDWEDGIFDQWEGGNYNPQGEWIPGGSYNNQGQFVEGNWTDEPQGVGDFEIANPAFVQGEPISENNPETITVTYPFEWVSVRKRVREVWGPFSEPTLWSTFSREHTVEIGDDGYWWIDGKPTDHKAEGEDGKGIDLKGRVDFLDSYHEEQFMQENPNFSFEPGHVVTYLKDVDDETSDDFRDPEVGDCYVVTYNGHIYLYVGGEEADWTKHWHDFGEFQGEGAYVHIAWADNVEFSPVDHETIINISGFVLDKRADRDKDYNWMGICTDHNWEDPDDYTKYKWNHARGRDGDSFERVFIRTEIEQRPLIGEDLSDSHGHTKAEPEFLPYVTNIQDNLNVTPPIYNCHPDSGTNVGSQANPRYQFTDDPQGVTSTLPYEWVAERKKEDGQWKSFNRATLWATYSHDGQSILRSTLFKRSEDQPDPPQAAGSFQHPNPENSGWSDGIPPGTGPIWKTEKLFTSDGEDPQWDYWTTPVLVQDDDNMDVELSMESRNTTPHPAPPVKYEEATTSNKCNSHRPQGYDSNLVEDQIWYDPELDRDTISANSGNINWMATRYKYVTVDGEPAWKPWSIILIKGEDGGTGSSGIGFQHAYISVSQDYVPNIVESPQGSGRYYSTVQGATGEWTIGTMGVIVNPGEFLWMSERTVQDGTYGPWGNPIRLSGDNGQPGEDAENIEFIYKRSNRLPNNTSTNNDKPTLNDYTSDGFIPNYDEHPGTDSSYNIDQNSGWTDNPQGVGYFTEGNSEVFYKYEWMCQRIKPRTSDPDELWLDWSNVFVWSAYGDTGMDGDGVEYIYTRNSSVSNTAPDSPYVKTQTHNNSTGILWEGGVYLDGNRWKPKDLPSSEGDFIAWIGGEYNPQGEWIPEGSYDNQTGNFVEGNWTDEPKGVEENKPYEWVSQRKCTNGKWGNFSKPTVWANYTTAPEITIDENGNWCVNGEPLTDKDGNPISAEGPAGQGIQLKDTVDVIQKSEKQDYSTEHNIPLADVTSLQEVNPLLNPEKYGDIAPGDCYVVKNNRYLYVCINNAGSWSDINQNVNDGTWDFKYNWAEVGEFQGEPGLNSYMHIAWAASVDKDPVKIEGDYYTVQGNNINFDSEGKITLVKKFLTKYEDKNPDTDYDWMGVRTDNYPTDPPSDYDLTTDTASTTTASGNWSLYKWNHVRGRDGDNYERVYLKTKTKCDPDFPKEGGVYSFGTYTDSSGSHSYQDPEYLPAVDNYDSNEHEQQRFSDDPKGVDPTYRYEWMAERRKKFNTETHQVEWFPFSKPSLWARYSEDGKNGGGIQIRYISVSSSISSLTIDSNSLTSDPPISTIGGTPMSWKSNTAGLTIDSENFLWMTQREYTEGETTHNNWNTPVRLSGEDGEPGKDGSNLEFIYKRSKSLPTSSTHPGTEPYLDKEFEDDDYVPEGWTDSPSGVGYFTENGSTVFYKYEWAAQRTKPAGVNQSWSSWSPVFVWSAYGDAGMDGDGVEYVFFRWDGPSDPEDDNKFLKTPSIPVAIDSRNNRIEWNGKVYLKDNPNNPPQSDDWLPKDWSSEYSFLRWDANCGYYNQQGEWIPVVKVTDNDSTHPTSVNPNNSETNIYWEDEPKGVGKFTENGQEVYHIREWVSMRKRINGGDWGPFSEPKLWASFGSDVHISGGRWIINGQDCGQAEGKDGTGVSIKGSVDVILKKDVTGTKKSLQEVNPDLNSSNYNSVLLGDCYVVTDTRHLYTCINDTDWPDSYSETWDFRSNWEDIGEFQGEGSFMHIAWATDGAVNIQNGQIQYVSPYYTRYEDLANNVEYNWIGICTDHNELDPPDNYGDTSYNPENEETWNWKKYKWNHVKGKDGSDYEKVYLRTKTNDRPEFVDGYQNTSGYQNPEYLPAVKNYSSSQHSGVVSGGTCTFTDDPVGVEAAWPYEWMAERKKKFDSSTGLMKWFAFSDPSLWATYSFDGITAYTTNSGDRIIIDAAGNPVGGIGSASNPRFYTEVKIYDPRLDNGDGTFGGYLSYQSGTGTPSTGKYKLTITKTPNEDKFAYAMSGEKIYISSLGGDDNTWRLEHDECKLEITATISNGKTFNFEYKITLEHSPRTYLTYTLTNDFDTFTYRTKTGKYDGLPIATTLEVLSTDGTPQKLNESENISDGGYIQSLSVTSSLLANAYTSKTYHTSSYKVNNSTLTTANTSVGSDGALGVRSKTAYIYDSNDNYTNLKLVIKSNGEVSLDRDVTANLDVDLPDSSYNMEISCTAILGGVTYTSLKKVFKFTERNDATLYKLWLSGDTFNILPGGGYSPAENTFQVKVNVKDETGLSTVTPVSTDDWLVGNNVKVRYINGNPATTPGNDTLLSLSNLSFSEINNNFFTVVVVEYNSSNQPVFYHDTETIDLVSPGISQTYVKVLEDRCIIECDKDGKILGDSNIVFKIRAQLMWGDTECLSYNTGNSDYIISEGFEYTTNSSNTTKPCLIGNIGTDSSYTPARWGLNLTFRPDKVLTSGTITIVVVGSFNGVTRSATKTISIEASRQGEPGPTGPTGDFLATAFIRTNTDISQWQPIGLETNENCPTGFSGTGHSISESWEDGIPEGNKTLWASTLVIKGDESTNTNGWTLPRKMMDTQYYDVEFALRQPNDGTPSDPSPDNRHKDGVASGYDGQIWFDPEDDAAYVEANHKNFYWRAERESNNGNTPNVWIVTRIKGESQPWVSLDHGMFTINLNSSGILESNQTLYVHSYLKVGDITQTVSYSDCSYSVSPTNNGISVSPSAYSSGGVLWTINLTSGLSYSNTEITITLKNSTYTAVSENIVILFVNKNQSQITSYIFKRGSSAPTKPGNSIGSYSEPGPNSSESSFDWTGWSDGLPSGSNNIYMSSRIFTSDGQVPQQTAWTSPTKLTFTDSATKGLRFSLADAFPGKPGDTGKYWYNLGDSYSLPGGKTMEDMIWMATGTRANSSSSWSWEVMRIKGETAETGRSIDSIWYKAFDTLDVTIPSITLTIEDLYAQGWNEGYIQPTKDNQYLWKFTRTAYINPDSIDHKGLDLVQVWAENMINPNLLDDTEFTDINHISAWTQAGKPFNSTYTGTITTGIESNAYNNKNSFYVNSNNCSVSIYILQQYVTGKIVSDEWYTLSFWVKCSKSGNNTIHVSIKFGNPSTVSLDATSSLNYTNDTSSDQAYIQLKNISNSWSRRTITFKSSDPTSNNYYEYIQFMMLNTTGTSRRFDFCMPKLETGKVATDYVVSLVKDPYPRLTVWGTGKQYYRGNYGEPYLDAVTYGTNWFRCRNTHISSNSNKPVMGQTTAYWEPAQNLDFIVTDLLLAETGYIKNLVVGGLRTGDRGTAHVEMEGATINFYGNLSTPSIEMQVDPYDGMAYLRFFDINHEELYDLGPNGIKWLRASTSEASWTTIQRVNLTSNNNNPDFNSGGSTTNLYKFKAKVTNNVIVGSTQTGNDANIAELANGRYFTSQTTITLNNNTGDLNGIVTGLYRSSASNNNPWIYQNLGNEFDNDVNSLKNKLVNHYKFPEDLIYSDFFDWSVEWPGDARLVNAITVQGYDYFDKGILKETYALGQFLDTNNKRFAFNLNFLNS